MEYALRRLLVLILIFPVTIYSVFHFILYGEDFLDKFIDWAVKFTKNKNNEQH